MYIWRGKIKGAQVIPLLSFSQTSSNPDTWFNTAWFFKAPRGAGPMLILKAGWNQRAYRQETLFSSFIGSQPGEIFASQKIFGDV